MSVEYILPARKLVRERVLLGFVRLVRRRVDRPLAAIPRGWECTAA